MSNDPDRSPGEADPFDALLRRAARLTPVSDSSAPRAYPGLRLCGGRYEITRQIGAGGMGVVHAALDRERDRTVALKTLSQLDAAGIYRLKAEFRALAETSHPNLVRLYELFEDRGFWAFTMELVEGVPFDRWVRAEGELDVARLSQGLVQLADGVGAIHAAGKLHRDLKPSNVLITESGRVVILDFGLIAEPELGAAGQTVGDAAFAGTPAYVSPEQAGGAASTQASDWYAVGVMLFEALTGGLPFDGPPRAVLERKQRESPPSPRALVPEVPQELDALCAGLLARDPSARGNGDEIAAALDQRAAPSEAPARPTTAGHDELFGREQELERLRHGLQTATAGRPVLIRVSGESGIGKTALVSTFLDEARDSARALVLQGRCHERETLPYKAFDRIVDALSRHLRQRTDAEAAALLPRDVRALARIFTVLDRVDQVARAPARVSAGDRELRERAFAAMAELLARIRDRRMLIVHIDDVQWIDEDSLVLVEHLIGHPDPAPILWIICHRTAVAIGTDTERSRTVVSAGSGVTQLDVELGPLAPHAARALAMRLLSHAPDIDRLADTLVRESQRSPFLLGELAQEATRVASAGESATYLLDEAMRRRATRLGEAERRLIEVLAVAAQPTPIDVLLRAAAMGDDADRALDVLMSARLARHASERRVECYHDRIREAFLEGLPAERARDCHARLAAAWAERDDADPATLFTHLIASEQPRVAGASALRAAERAKTALAFERCAELLARAIEVLPGEEVVQLGLHEQRAEALSLAGRWADAGQAFSEAAERAADDSHEASLLHRAALHFLGSGDFERGLPRLRRVLHAAGIRWPRSRIGALVSSLGRACLLWLRLRGGGHARRGAAEPVAAKTESLDRLLDGAGLLPPYDFVLGFYFMSAFAVRALRFGNTSQQAVALGMAALWFSRLRATRSLAERLAVDAAVLARTAVHPQLASAALAFASCARMLDGRLREAHALGMEAERVLAGHEREHVLETWGARTTQAFALVLLGRCAEAAHRFAANAQLAHQVGDDMALVGGDSVLRHLVADDVERARNLLARKEEMLARTEGLRGGLHEIVRVERWLLMLYEGRGAELARNAPRRQGGAWAFFETDVLHACAALQASPPDRPFVRAAVQRGIRRLRRHGSAPGAVAMSAQLRASLHALDGNTAGAIDELARAAEAYALAEMALHAALVRWRRGALLGGAEGQRVTEEARQEVLACGIAQPEAWAQMLVPNVEAS